MYVDRIPQFLLAMYRSVALSDFAEILGVGPLHEYQEDFFMEMSERTINKHLMDPGFQCFPVVPLPKVETMNETPNPSHRIH